MYDLFAGLLFCLLKYPGFFWFNLFLGVTCVAAVIVILYLKLKAIENEKQQVRAQLIEKDRTLQKALQELQTSKQTLEQTNRERSEFLSSMTHEFRSYLNVILGYTQIFSKHRLSRKQRNALDIIHRNSEQLLHIITDILSLSQIETKSMALEENSFNFRRFLGGLAELTRAQAEHKSLGFQQEFSPDLPKVVYGDEKSLRQILRHLLNNAVKFTNTGSVIFRVLPIAYDAKRGTRIRLEIEDSGIGIPYDHLRDIFQPFHHIGNRHKKNGSSKLGLTISQNLAQLLGSEIQVTSKKGQGSVFWFDLDLPENGGDDESPDAEIEDMIVGFKGPLRKILIADERYENRALLKEMLLPLGFGILESEDGFDVLAKAAQHHPDLILIDLTMPVLNGFEAIRHLRQMPAIGKVIVIGMSASVLPQIQEESRKAGSDAFLSKPLHFDDLLDRLQRYLKLEWIYGQEQELQEEVP
ncbi:MAG: response regulator [bacterium]|nr:response regulator [bacterium]